MRNIFEFCLSVSCLVTIWAKSNWNHHRQDFCTGFGQNCNQTAYLSNTKFNNYLAKINMAKMRQISFLDPVRALKLISVSVEKLLSHFGKTWNPFRANHMPVVLVLTLVPPLESPRARFFQLEIWKSLVPHLASERVWALAQLIFLWRSATLK